MSQGGEKRQLTGSEGLLQGLDEKPPEQPRVPGWVDELARSGILKKPTASAILFAIKA